MKSINSSGRKRFEETRWTLIGALGEPQGIRRTRALEEFCRIYWYPLYHFARRKGYSPVDSEDLTQALFEKLLAGDALKRLESEKGRVRSFLLRSFSNLMASEWQRKSSPRRGGGLPHIPLDIGTAETRFQAEPAGSSTPEQDYERHWVCTLLLRASSQLEEEFRDSGRDELYTVLSPCLGGSTETGYADLAERLGMTVGAIKVSVHRMRKRYRTLLVREISLTVPAPEDVVSEISHILRIFQ